MRFDEEVLEFPYRLQLGPQALIQLPKDVFVLPGQEDLPCEQVVPQGVQADGGLPLRRLGPGALEGVAAVCLGLLGAGHVLVPFVCKDAIRQIVLGALPLPRSETLGASRPL